jgi:putative addiction module component (TIGR02574 family)
MSTSSSDLFQSALALPQAERADLAFQLLQSLVPPGEEISADEFGAQLHERVAAYRRNELPSFSLEEARTIIRDRLSQDRAT